MFCLRGISNNHECIEIVFTNNQNRTFNNYDAFLLFVISDEVKLKQRPARALSNITGSEVIPCRSVRQHTQ